MACCKSFHLKCCHFCSSIEREKKKRNKITCSNATYGRSCEKKQLCNLISSKFSCIKSLLLIEEILCERGCENSCKTPQALLLSPPPPTIPYSDFDHGNLDLQPMGSCLFNECFGAHGACFSTQGLKE